MNKRPYSESHGSSHKRPRRSEDGNSHYYNDGLPPKQSFSSKPGSASGLQQSARSQTAQSQGVNASRDTAVKEPPKKSFSSMPSVHTTQYQQPAASKQNHQHTAPDKNVKVAATDYTNALRTLPAVITEMPALDGSMAYTTPKGLPDLPEVTGEHKVATFRHKSMLGYDRSSATSDKSYELLEFMGDAYLELFATRLIFHHYQKSGLTAGNMSQCRELLIKNETLAEFARLYKFEDRIILSDMQGLEAAAQDRGNKGLNKILADCFEAYVAAVILSDTEHGVVIAERWLQTLWAPKLAAFTESEYRISARVMHHDDADPLKIYDSTAKATLQKKILTQSTKLEYKPTHAMVELKGDQIGLNRHYIGVFLTGYGYKHELLGQGEGKNKVEAGNWAATQAMHGKSKEIVQTCEKQMLADKEARRKKAEEEAQAAQA